MKVESLCARTDEDRRNHSIWPFDQRISKADEDRRNCHSIWPFDQRIVISKENMTARSKVVALLAAAAAAALPTGVNGANAWINEFHYRNKYEDVGTFIEIVGPCGEEAYEYEVVLYQGRDGQQVGSWDGLHEAKSLTGHYFNGQDESVDSGHCYLVIDIDGNAIRNGKKVADGIALTRNNVCIQFISYGSESGTAEFEGTSGPCKGFLSQDIGTFEPRMTPEGFSLQLQGTGHMYEDFVWNPTPLPDTRGRANHGQTFEAAAFN